MKHDEGGQSFAMSSLSKKSAGEREWGRRVGDSDESILREHGGGGGLERRRDLGRRDSVRNGGIMRTTDVVITRGEGR